MNISTQHQSLHPVQSVKAVEHHAQTLSETHAVGGPSATAEHAIQQRDQMHLSETRAQTHGVSPLKVLSLHGGVLAAEHGLHFSLHKLSTHQISTTQANTVNTLGNVSGAVASGYLTYTAIEHAIHAVETGHNDAATAYGVSAALDAGLAVANTLAVFKRAPAVSVGVSLGVGLLSTASSVLGAKLEHTASVSH